MSPKKDASADNLSGPEKAAVFLLMLGEDYASEVFKRLDDEEIRNVGRQMAKIDRVDKEDVSALLAEFKTDSGGGDIFLSGDDMLESALRRALTGDKAGEILDDIRSDWRLTLFQKARKLDPKVLVNFLRNEHPQTVALVLSVLDNMQASSILAELKEEIQVEVVMRMAELDKVSPEILVEIDRVLQEELLSVEGMEGQRLGGVDGVAGERGGVHLLQLELEPSGLEDPEAGGFVDVRDRQRAGVRRGDARGARGDDLLAARDR